MRVTHISLISAVLILAAGAAVGQTLRVQRDELIPSPTFAGVDMCRVAKLPKSSATGRKNCSVASIS